jgi:Pyruvate/2-oxoacid:ferredoxin oxidoreductase gamma subunit
LRKALRLLSKNVKWVEATQIARSLGDIQALNMVMMGALVGSGFIRLGMEGFKKAIRSVVSKRLVDLDLSAFEAGFRCQRAEETHGATRED